MALAALGVALKNGLRLSDVLDSMGWLPWGQIALGVVGFIIAQVMAVNVTAFALFIFPLLVARQFYQSSTALKSVYKDTIRSLIGALEAKDPYTRGHSERVAEYAVLIGRQAGLDSRSLDDLENAALLHDLGKLALPGPLLRKAGALNDDEWCAIREHPNLGADLVRRIPPLRPLADVVERHHERLDGSGYPLGLTGQGLSVAVRILAIADSFDAMTSDRPYRAGLSAEEALAELRQCSPSQLDPDLVEALAAANEWGLSVASGGASALPVVVEGKRAG
jgi:HD-GYP domain-containing protein (c-di-GMP phosphodiesterase class II)